MQMPNLKSLGIATLLSLTVVSSSYAANNQLASFHSNANSVSWTSQLNDTLSLTISGPDDFYTSSTITTGSRFSLDNLADGAYTYQLVLTPTVDSTVKEIMRQARESGDYSQIKELRRQGVLPNRPTTQTGYFMIVNGSVPRSNVSE